MTKKKVTQEQRQYIQGIIHNLALQRWQDKEIAEFLNNDKDISNVVVLLILGIEWKGELKNGILS